MTNFNANLYKAWGFNRRVACRMHLYDVVKMYEPIMVSTAVWRAGCIIRIMQILMEQLVSTAVWRAGCIYKSVKCLANKANESFNRRVACRMH